MSYSVQLTKISNTLKGLTDACFHFFAPPDTGAPYIVWQEESSEDLLADNIHAETCIHGTIDIFTKKENDPLLEKIPAALDNNGISYYLNSSEYEEETGLLHYEFVFEVI